MSQPANIDGVLIQWGDRLLHPGDRIVKRKPQPSLGGLAARQRAAAIRERIVAAGGVPGSPGNGQGDRRRARSRPLLPA